MLVFARVVTGCGVTLLAAPAFAQWTVTTLSPPGASGPSRAIAAAGGTQVGSASVSGVIRAGVWSRTAGSWVDLHPSNATVSIASAALGNRQGGYAVISGVQRASLWTGTAASRADLHPTGVTQSQVLGMGQVGAMSQQVGVVTASSVQRATLWSGTAGSRVDLAPINATESRALATSGTQQVGYAVIDFVSNASLWTGTQASWVNLSPAGSLASNANAVDASFPGGRQFGDATVDFNGIISAHASMWSGTAASWVDLHPAVATESRIYGAEGGQQVGYAVVNGVASAAIWSGTAASYVDLHVFVPSIFTRSEARAISRDATNVYVVGTGLNSSSGRTEALLWTLALTQPCDDIDFNNNTVFPEDQDVIDFFTVLAGGECSPGNVCNDIDFNNNTVFPEDQDVIDFFNVLAGGDCP